MNNVGDKRSKHWCMTINNPTSTLDSYWDPALMSYFICGEEFGEEHEIPHHQAYVCFINRKRLTGVKKLFPRAHLEIKFGTVQEALTYCKKDGKFLSFGVVPVTAKQALKRKWDDVWSLAKAGEYELIAKDILIPHYKNIKQIHADNPPKLPALTMLGNYWIHGATGVGKTHLAIETFPDYFDKLPTKWWDGYQGEETILLDDMAPGLLRLMSYYLKRWADLYPFPVEIKGSSMMIRPRHIVVTSQYSINQCFEYDNKTIYALQRRFKEIKLESYTTRESTFNLLPPTPAGPEC